jgi:hypothetical protein
MSLTKFIGLVSETDQVNSSELQRVAGAIDKQVKRDFAGPWGISASVNSFASLDDVPTDYWVVVVRDDIGYEGAAGIHLDQDGQPFALVQADSEWSLTASHEVLEMLADPFGNRLVAGESPKSKQGRVNFLVEVCDPSEAADCGYTVNGVLVSDFYFPSFFDPVGAKDVRYSFTSSLPRPRDIVREGYLSWMMPETGKWYQKTFFGSRPKYVSLGRQDASYRSLREFIDRNTKKPLQQRRGSAKAALTASAVFSRPAEVKTASCGKAGRLRVQLNALLKRDKGHVKR